MSTSLTKNGVFYFVYNLLNMLFPFLTSLYVARVLPPASIGEVTYAQNIVSYFAILAFLGIPTYGLREISKVRNNRDKLNNLFSELFIINFFSTIFFSLIYYGMVFLMPIFKTNLLLYCVVGITVILNTLNISWLFEGLEEFRYISIRNAVFKFLMFSLLVLVVRRSDDVIPYVVITLLGIAGNNVVNIIYSRKFISFQLNDLCFIRHVKPILMLVTVNLAIEIYSLVGTSMLGVLASKESVAFYFYADRTNKVLLQVANTITMVLVPRIALYYSIGKMTEFNQLLTKALKILVMVTVPMIIGIQFTADFLFPALFGDAYIRSASLEKVLCIVLLVAPVGYLLGSRVMLVSGNEKKMVICVGAGALANVIGNYFLIRIYGEFGAALSCLIGEIVVAMLYVNYGRKVFNLYTLKRNFVNIGIASVTMSIYLVSVSALSYWNTWGLLVVKVIGAIFVYFLTLLLLKDTIICEYSKRLFSQFR